MIDMEMGDPQIPAIYLLTPGLVVTSIGIVCLVWRLRFLRRARRTWGMVLSMESRYPSGPFNMRGVQSIPCYVPNIRFTTTDGLRYEFVEYAVSRFLSPQVGRQIPVVYDPRHPHRACIDHWLPLWSRGMGITIIGLLLLGLGILCI
jgi:hypothetical protein